MPSLLIFVLVLGVLMAVHELGHYLAARWAGVRVDRFSFWGVGPRLFGKKIGDTDFCVSLFPVGAYVQMAGEGEGDAAGAPPAPHEFRSQTPLKKFLIVFAGPFMNALLAFLLFSAVATAGEQALVPKISRVLKDSPAAAAGLAAGDRIRAVGGEPVAVWEDFTAKLQAHAGKSVLLSVQRGPHALEVRVAPAEREANVLGRTKKVAFLGISPSVEFLPVKVSWPAALWVGLQKTAQLTWMTLSSLTMIATGAMPFKESMTGPIGIFFMTRQAAEMGWLVLLHFTATLSVSLWVLNLLPIPVLDGGHILFLFVEKLKGSPLREKARERLTQAGMVFLLALMALVLAQDVDRFSILQNVTSFFKKGA